MVEKDKGLVAIVIPSEGSVEEDLERAKRAIRRNERYKIENSRYLPYIISGVGPDMNKALGYVALSEEETLKNLDFHRKLYDYMIENTEGFIGMDIQSTDSRGNILNTFPEGVEGTHALVSYHLHLTIFRRIIEDAQRKGEMSSEVEFEFVPTDQSPRQFVYGILALVNYWIKSSKRK